MQQKAHLFVVDDDTMPIHIQKGFCGIVKTNPANARGRLNTAYYGQLSDLMNVKTGDLVYFYMQTKTGRKLFELQNNGFTPLEQGYYGVFKVAGKPFISEDEVRGEYPFENYYIFGSVNNPNYNNYERTVSNRQGTVQIKPRLLPVRIPIKPIKDYYHLENRFVDDNQAYIDKTDEGSLSTLLFKKIKRIGEERSITPILPEEASKIARLIFKQEKQNFPLNISSNLVRNNDESKEVRLILSSSDGNALDSEAMLEAYILSALNNDKELGELSEIIGDYSEIEFCGNQVQYGISGNKVDVLLLHRKALGGNTSYRHKATVMELKKDAIKKDDVAQIIDYQKWVAQLTTHNNLKAIKPILIGKKPSSRMANSSKEAIKNDLEKIKGLGISAPVFFEYTLKIDNRRNITEVVFNKYDIYSIIT